MLTRFLTAFAELIELLIRFRYSVDSRATDSWKFPSEIALEMEGRGLSSREPTWSTDADRFCARRHSLNRERCFCGIAVMGLEGPRPLSNTRR